MKNVFHISEIEGSDISLFGRKASNLSTLYKMDRSLIPECIVIDKDVSRNYIETGGDFPKGFDKDLEKNLRKIEKQTKLSIDSDKAPFIFAVRVSLNEPIEGVKRSILNIGLNDTTVEGLINHYGRQKFALETYCRSIYQFAITALGVSKEALDKQKEAILNSERLSEYSFLNEKHLRELANLYKAIIFKETGNRYPEDPLEQLKIALETIYDSYDSERAKRFRKLHSMNDDGCAVIIQKMSFGNLGVGSAAGFIESRNPINGNKDTFGQFIHEGQGTDMTSKSFDLLDINLLEKRFPDAFKRLLEVSSGLEVLTKGPVSINFTIEDGQLNVIDIKKPKVSAKAELSIAADMLREEIIDTREALNSLNTDRLDQIFDPEIDMRSPRNVAFTGLSASTGLIQGKIYFDHSRLPEDGNNILVLDHVKEIENKNDLSKLKGAISLGGGMGSQIAEHCRNNGKPYVIRCAGVEYINWKDRFLETSSGIKIKEANTITLDANNGEVLIGDVLINQPDITTNLKYILTAADQVGKMKTYLKADNELLIDKSKQIGVENIGCFKMNNFLLDEDIIDLLRDSVFKLGMNKFSNLQSEMITKLKNKVKSLVTTCKDGEINFVLFDKSINEITPEKYESDVFADRLNVDEDTLFEYFQSKCNKNPEFGVMGAKLFIENPHLFEIQVRSIIEGVIEANKALISRSGKVKITLPGVSNKEEIAYLSNKFTLIKSDYENSETLNLSFGMRVDNMRNVLNIDIFLGFLDHLLIDLESVTGSLYGIGFNDGYQHISHKSNRFEYDPYDRLDVEVLGPHFTRLVDKFKGSTKGEIGVIGKQVTNHVTINFLDQIGIDYVVTTYKNNLITRIGAAQSRLSRMS